jgi:hypothetical protein
VDFHFRPDFPAHDFQDGLLQDNPSRIAVLRKAVFQSVAFVKLGRKSGQFSPVKL